MRLEVSQGKPGEPFAIGSVLGGALMVQPMGSA